MNKELEIVIRKMCEVVDVNFDTFEFKGEWYLKHSWTEDQMEEFRKWFVDHLYISDSARHAFMAVPKKNKKAINETWDYFNLQYGWSVV